MTLATCAMGLTLFVGSLNGHAMRCCVEYAITGVPPPDRPFSLQIDGFCQVKAHRRRWRRRRALLGVDMDGTILVHLCRKDMTDCCELTATGPTGTVVVPPPTSLAGIYTCPEGSGAYALDAVQ